MNQIVRMAPDRDAVSNDLRDERLSDVVEEFGIKIRNGDCPSIPQYLREHPDLADDLEPLLDTILTIEGMKGEQARDASGRVCLTGDELHQLGDFRIVREIGKGGMGVVFEAEQMSLKRLVALKVLPRQMLLRPENRERFQREAQLAAGLHHSNIVPVYGCGHEAGYHFYAMQLIEGTTLTALANASGSTAEPKRVTPQRLAEIGLQVAEALAYAHKQGVLHRDIKPANLIEDRNGRIWVTDFGLARRNFSDDMDCPGGGTERFIAPERREGRCDARADIFSLGVTLWDLAAGRRPSSNEPTASIQSSFLPSAAQIGSVRLDLPRDLAAILRKAMAVDVNKRYQSADELADDLRRFLENRPVAARPLSIVGRFAKLLRRNPIGSATVALLLIMSWSLALIYQRSNALAVQQNDKLSRAFFTVDALLWSNTAGVEQLEDSDRRSTSAPLAHWNTNPALKKLFPAGKFDAHFGDILDHLTRSGDFDADFVISEEMFDCAVRSRWHVAKAQREIGNLKEARLALEYALELAERERVRKDRPANYMPVIFSARLRNDLAEIAEAYLDFATADSYRRGVLELLDATPRSETDPSDLPERGRAYLGLGAYCPARVGLTTDWLYLDPSSPPPPIDPDSALQHLNEAVSCFEQYRKVDGNSPKSIKALARALRERERLHRVLGIATGTDLNGAIEMLTDLVLRKPETPSHRHDLAAALADTVWIGAEGGEDENIQLQRLNRAFELVHSLSRSHPQRTEFIETKISVAHKFAEFCLRQGDFDDAEEYFTDAIEHQRAIVYRFPRRSRSRAILALLEHRYAQLLDDRGQSDLAASLVKHAHRQFDNIPAESLDQPFLAAAHKIVVGPQPLEP